MTADDTTHPPAPMPTERGAAVENESERATCCGEMRWQRSVCGDCGHQEAWCASHGTTCGCPITAEPDPTAGERPDCICPDPDCKWDGQESPAEPDAGDVEALNIIFDGPPSHESGRFVEVETDDGRSIRAGKWIQRNDGLWALRIDLDAVRQNAADDRAEQIAQAIEAARDVSQAPNYRAGFDVAARIARTEAAS